jgi:ubiquinone/menaquinone biosynthesis C-methylase UbiE
MIVNQSIIKKYDTTVPDDTFFMNDGYCDFDSNGMPLSVDLELTDKFVKWKYQVNLYNKIINSTNVKNKDIDILDIACGRGGGVSFYKEILNFKNVYGVDLNPHHIELCKKNCKDISFHTTSAVELPFSDKSMNIITCVEADSYFEPYENYLKEVYRVLKDGGVFIQASPYLDEFRFIILKYFKIIKIENITNNVGMACAITKHLFKNDKRMLDIYSSDESRYLDDSARYQIYVMKK